MTENKRNERIEKSDRKLKSVKSEKSLKSQKKDGTQKKEENTFIIPESMRCPNILKENLEPFEDNTDFIVLMQSLKKIILNKDIDWTYHLGVINYLRRLLKFEISIFNQIMYGLKIYPKLVDLINSIRSVLAKNTLMLVNEMFSEYIPEYDDKKNKTSIIIFIKAILPTLIMKANCNQSFIKAEANLCLESLIKNMRYGDTLVALIQAMSNKKNQNIELAYNLANKLCDNLTKEYLGEFPLFNDLMKSIANIYELKKDIYVKKIIVLLKKINEKITQNEFNMKLEKCGKKEKELIKKALDPKINNKPKNKNSSSSSLQVLLKESKDIYKNKPNKIRKSITTTSTVLVKNKIENSGKKK
jgi:hypothetical protein